MKEHKNLDQPQVSKVTLHFVCGHLSKKQTVDRRDEAYNRPHGQLLSSKGLGMPEECQEDGTCLDRAQHSDRARLWTTFDLTDYKHIFLAEVYLCPAYAVLLRLPLNQPVLTPISR